MKLLAAVMLTLASACCSTIPSKEVRAWAKPNFPMFVAAVDQKYSNEDTRLNGYKSLASLICDADTADKKQATSIACKCQHATSSEASKQACTEFVQQYR